ncbi:MAG: hypothetical protein U0872_16130 [Planctomycetaceae bacterium]
MASTRWRDDFDVLDDFRRLLQQTNEHLRVCLIVSHFDHDRMIHHPQNSQLHASGNG